jgi:aspartyl-tRNA(Asn)/glutamyl-tRNA(Gln) amidotransferase subunit B
MSWELVAGLETHVELSTKTKIFCSCTTEFGGDPNTHCCPVCIGLPGTLPKLNREVVTYAVRAGLATNCRIRKVSKMDRKNYVYPDLPKAYQISQFDMPLCEGGYVELDSGKRIRITRIHIEEDAGKLVHHRGDTYIDYNRGGVPLIEIVSEPDIRSVEEATEYIDKLRLIMKHIGVSDVKMQEGSLRCDVNVSVRKEGETALGIRAELKNMNSVNFIAKAMAYEFERQVDILENGGTIDQETRRYDSDQNVTESMRSKEDADDYRYFREPDLSTICLTDEEIEDIDRSLPELPQEKVRRYTETYGLSPVDAELLARYRRIAEYFDAASEGTGHHRIVANLILGQVFRRLPLETDKEAMDIAVSAEDLKELSILIGTKKLTPSLARNVLEQMLDTGKKVHDLVSESDLEGIDETALRALCEKAVAENPEAVASYRNGKEKAFKSIIGQIMKETKGKADAVLAGEIVREIIGR